VNNRKLFYIFEVQLFLVTLSCISSSLRLSRVYVNNSIILFSPVPKYDANDNYIFKVTYMKILGWEEKLFLWTPLQCNSAIALHKLFSNFLSIYCANNSHKRIELSSRLLHKTISIHYSVIHQHKYHIPKSKRWNAQVRFFS